MVSNRNIQSQQAEVIPFIQNSEYFFSKGLRSYRKHDLKRAKRFIERAISMEPDESVYVCQLAVVYTEMGDYKKANELLETVVENLEPDMIDCYYFMANNYAYMGHFLEAEKCVKRYLAEAPVNGEYIDEAMDLLELLSLEDEHEMLEIEDEEDLIDKQDEACQLLEAGKFEEAVKILEMMVKDYPKFWSAHNNLSLAYFYLGKVNQALELTRDVLEKNEGNLHALCNLAVFQYYLDNETEAHELLNSLKNIRPIDYDQRYKLGVTFALLGDHESAYERLRKLQSKRYEGAAAFYYWLAVSSYHVGNEAYSREIWKKVLEFSPERKGSEPWGGKVEFRLYNSIITENNDDAMSIYAIYMLGKISNKRLIELENTINIEDYSSLVWDVYQYLLKKSSASPEIQLGMEIADLIYQSIGIIAMKKFNPYQSPIFYWFKLYIRLIDNKLSLKNTNAFAGAIYYMWKKEKQLPVSQQEVAEIFEVSKSTLQLVLKKLKEKNNEAY